MRLSKETGQPIRLCREAGPTTVQDLVKIDLQFQLRVVGGSTQLMILSKNNYRNTIF